MLSLYGDLFDHPLSARRRPEAHVFSLRQVPRQHLRSQDNAGSILRSALHDFERLENELFQGFPYFDTNGILNRHSFNEACLQPLKSDDPKFWGFSLGTSDYSPENLKVELDDRCLSIKGTQKPRAKMGNKKNPDLSRECSRFQMRSNWIL